jgi:hypothetical protein
VEYPIVKNIKGVHALIAFVAEWLQLLHSSADGLILLYFTARLELYRKIENVWLFIRLNRYCFARHDVYLSPPLW